MKIKVEIRELEIETHKRHPRVLREREIKYKLIPLQI